MGSPALVAVYSVTIFSLSYRSSRKNSSPILKIHRRMIYQNDHNNISPAKTERFFKILLLVIFYAPGFLAVSIFHVIWYWEVPFDPQTIELERSVDRRVPNARLVVSKCLQYSIFPQPVIYSFITLEPQPVNFCLRFVVDHLQ